MLFKSCKSKNLEVNFLINNAGIGQIGDFEAQDLDKMEKMLVLNMISLTKIIYLFLPELKKNKGCIINVASQASFMATPYMAAYGATKAYVLSLTESLWAELKVTNLTIMALCPGPTYTKFFERADTSTECIRSKFRSPEEVVNNAISGIENKKLVTKPGWENSLTVFLSKFIPRKALLKISSNFVKKESNCNRS